MTIDNALRRGAMMLVLIVLLGASVQALPAPVGVLGTITDGGVPVVGVEVTLRAFVDGDTLVASSDSVVTNDAGMFYALVTLDESVPVDVQVLIASDEPYAEVIEGAVGWEQYEVSLELSDGSFGIPAPAPEEPLPGIKEFEEDLDALTDDASMEDALLEKYGAEVSERPALPVVEGPAFVPAPAGPRSSRIVFEVAAVILLLVLVLVVRHEVRRRQ